VIVVYEPKIDLDDSIIEDNITLNPNTRANNNYRSFRRERYEANEKFANL